MLSKNFKVVVFKITLLKPLKLETVEKLGLLLL